MSRDELERQVERGNLFTHTALTDFAVRANETEAMVNGLVDYLVARGVADTDGLIGAIEAARREAVERGELATTGVAIRVDPDGSAQPEAVVDCEARLPVCKAVCCRLRFALTVEEVETGPVRWDLGKPYYNRQDADGYCHCMDGERHGCTVYADRPSVCRSYSCAGDARIWKDFERMELNQEWIDANLLADELRFVEVLMERKPPRGTRAGG